MGLWGRKAEQELLTRLLSGAREGRSGVLVLRGEPGIGKTALLDDVVARASGLRISQVAGIESEMELAYAALHQLCTPLLNRIGMLPGPQAAALRVALGLSDGGAPDRFLLGLAVLTLIGEAAAERPIVCIVDDAQWIDRASLLLLAFVARRLQADPVLMLFAVREPALERELAPLPVRVLEGVDDTDARALLDETVVGHLDDQVRDSIVAEAGGNPLALLELHRVLSPAELAGGFGLAQAKLRAQAKSVVTRIEAGFGRRLQDLPPLARTLLLVAAAEPTGSASRIWSAAKRLNIDMGAAAAAEAAELVTINSRFRFRHPLVRSVIYRNAAVSERRGVHEALADAVDEETEPDLHAWHRAHATAAPDDAVADELQCCAHRARARGAVAAAAAFLVHATTLTPDPQQRAERALAAAQAKLDAGAADSASEMLALAEASNPGEMTTATISLLRAKVAFATNRGNDAPPLLMAAAQRLTPLNPHLARETYFEALVAAIFAGRLGGMGGQDVRKTAEAARQAPPAQAAPRGIDLMLDGLAARFTDGYKVSAPLLKRALETFCREDAAGTANLGCYQVAGRIALDLFDHATYLLLSVRQIEALRAAGVLPWLPLALAYRAAACVDNGDFIEAAALLDQAVVVEDATGLAAAHYVQPYLSAHRGQDQRTQELVQTAVDSARDRGEGRALTQALYSTAILGNGEGRYEEALAAARAAAQHDDVGTYGFILSELIEAGTRCGVDVVDAARELEARAEASGMPTGLGIAARSRALLLADSSDAEAEYLSAVGHLESGGHAVHLARTHLVYGEWLRRAKRRRDARAALRSAYEMFSDMGAYAFAERARRELLATGESVRKRSAAQEVTLTTQENYIVRLARNGHTNVEIAAQLFISPRTVEWHLSKIFAKLGIASRRELKTTEVLAR